MPIRNRLAEMHPQITAWRRDFHMHPELLYDTERTAGIVADKLRAFGCDEVVTGIGKTGVVGLIHGRTTASGRTIGLRADMDALPIFEATGAEYASTVPGKMHACGHDGHTAMLLGAAQYLAETRQFDGTIAVIFQPAEEGGAGALAMVEDGMIDRLVAGDCDTQAPRTTGGEDFAYMLQACPGAYIQIGNGPSKGLHHPEYDFNDEIIPIGASYWVTLAEQRLPA